MIQQPAKWRWQHHPELASTQDAAIQAAHAGDPGRLAILADRQTAGRGSRGRPWIAPAGNLNLSVLLRPNAATPDPGRWALMAGIALHQVLEPHAPGLLLKWPNDLILGGGKLAGILIDSQIGQGPQPDWVVIGFGANLATAPTIEGRQTTQLPPPAPKPGAIAEAILNRLDPLAEASTAYVCQAWLARAHPIGTLLDVRTPQTRVTGAFAGLAATGELLLEGHAPIGSAEVALWQ